MKKTLTILILLISFSAIGQRSKLGFKFLPGIADSHSPNEEQYFQNRIKPRFNFNFGAQYIFQFKDSLISIESGVYLLNRGNVQRDFFKDFSFYGLDSTVTFDIYMHSYFISVPILFRIEFKNIYFSIGPSIDYYQKTKYVRVGDDNETYIRDWSNGFSEDIKLGLDLNIGSQFQLNNRTGVFIEGSFHPSGFAQEKFSKKWFYYLNYELGVGLNFLLKI